MRSILLCGLVVASAALSCRTERVPTADAPQRASGKASPGASGAAAPGAPRDEERRALFTRVFSEAGIEAPSVRAALLRVPRHRFVPEDMSALAYEDRPLPIGHGQTISQPAVVAVMTAAVAPRPTDGCLEIGTGSGYQAAVLAELCARVYSIEIVEPVARFGERNLRAAGYGPERVQLRVGDGYQGWPEAAPFQVIVVTAAPEAIPRPLLEQLAVGGRLIVPVGGQFEVQSLELIERVAAGSGADAFERQSLMPVRFVPFVRGEPR